MQSHPFLQVRPRRAQIVVRAASMSNCKGIREYMNLHLRERLLIEAVVGLEV